MQLSIQKRWEIVFLYLHRLGPKLGIRAIAKELRCSKDTVQTWINRYQETGDIQEEEKQGRKRKTSEKEDLDIISIAKKHRISLSIEISLSMSKKETDISSSTMRRRLNEQSLYKLEPLKKPLLSDTNKDNRLMWAKANKNTD